MSSWLNNLHKQGERLGEETDLNNLLLYSPSQFRFAPLKTNTYVTVYEEIKELKTYACTCFIVLVYLRRTAVTSYTKPM